MSFRFAWGHASLRLRYGDGSRVLQVNVSGTSILTTAYAGALEVSISSTARITKTYYSAGSQLIAMRVATSTAQSTLYHSLLPDRVRATGTSRQPRQEDRSFTAA